MIDLKDFPTREKAKEMLEMVSPIYEESYVGKWIFQILGLAMEIASDEILGLEEEAFPNTASKLLYLWEELYGIDTNPDLSDAERQSAIVARRNYRRPMNPARIAAMITDLTGREAFVRENTAEYEYEVCILPGDSEVVLDAVRSAIERVQQAKIVNIIFEAPSTVRIRADPKKKKYGYDMTSTTRKAGTYPEPASISKVVSSRIELSEEDYRQKYPYEMSGTMPEPSNIGRTEDPGVVASAEKEAYWTVYKMCGSPKL